MIIQTADGAPVQSEYRGDSKNRTLWYSLDNGKTWVQFNSRSRTKLVDFIKIRSLQQLTEMVIK